MTGTLAAAAPTITAPSIEWSQLSPIWLVFVAGLAGVLVEAFAPRDWRRPLHITLTLGSLAAAFVLAVVIAAKSSIFAHGNPGHVAAVGAVAVDRPTLFLQATILVLAFVSVLLIAESSHEVSSFTAAGRRGPRQRRGARGPAGRAHPHRGLPADPVRGGRHAAVPGRQRPADHVRRARGAVAAAVPDVRAGPAPPAALPGGSHEVLPARRVLLGLLPVRHRHAVRLLRLGAAVGDRLGGPGRVPRRPRCCTRASR